MNMESNKGLKIELSKKLMTEIQESLKQPDENINFAYFIFCGQAVIGSVNYSEETREFIKNTFKDYIFLNQKLINLTKVYTLENKEQLFLMY